jgi:Flp pilus assembly protein TadD
MVRLRQGRFSEALEHFQQEQAVSSDAVEPLFNAALANARLGRRVEAIAAAEKALVLARTQDQPQLVRHIEAWLDGYRNQPNSTAVTK